MSDRVVTGTLCFVLAVFFFVCGLLSPSWEAFCAASIVFFVGSYCFAPYGR